MHLRFSAVNFPLLLWLGILTFFVALIAFEALKRGKLSVVEVVWEIELPVSVFLGIVFLRESLSLLQALLIAIIFIGIILVAVKSPRFFFQASFLEKGFFLALAAAVGMGFMNFMTAVGAKEVSPLLAIWFPWVIFTVMSFSVIGARGGFRKFFGHARKFPRLIIPMGVFDTLGWFLFAVALSKRELSIVTAITESYPAIGLALGRWFNKEKIVAHQYAGAALALAASFTTGIRS